MKNLPLLLGTIFISVVLIIGIAVLFSQPSKSASLDPQELLAGARHFQGPETAPVTIVEFSDLQCPACKAAQPLVEQVLADNPDSVRLVYRHFPLDSLHPYARLAAQASEAMATQDKFWQFETLLYDRQEEWAASESQDQAISFLTQYAQELGVEVASFSAAFAQESAAAGVSEDASLGNRIGISATPTFYVNGNITPATNLQQAVSAALGS